MSRRRPSLLVFLLLLGHLLPAAAGGISSGNGIPVDADGSGAADSTLDRVGRLGLATIAPGGNLHARGNLLLIDGTAAAGRVLACNARGGSAWTDTSAYTSPWTSAGGNLTYAAGWIGIGTATPSANLHVAGNLYLPGSNAGLDRVLACDATGAASWVTLPSLSPYWTFDGNSVYRATGNVGVGTTAPVAALEVAGGNLLITGGNVVSARRGANPTRIDATNTWSSGSSWEASGLDWRSTANSLTLGSMVGPGGGSARNVILVHGGSAYQAGGYYSGVYCGVGTTRADLSGSRAAWVGSNCLVEYYRTGIGYSATAWNGDFCAAIGANALAGASTSVIGRTSFSSGYGPAPASSFQSGLQALGITTTNATPTKLEVPNRGSSNGACALASGSSVAVSGRVLAVSQDNTQTASFQVFAVFQNNAGTTTMAGNSITQVSNNGNAWSLSASGNNTTDRWDLTATGSSGNNIIWAGMLLVTEAAY